MKLSLKATVAAAALIVSTGGAMADCGIESGRVDVLGNDFAALRAITDWAGKCASDSVTVSANHTEEHKNIQVPALSTDPATYTVAIVATNSVVPLLNNNLIRPLDDLVAEHGQQLQDSQLIRVDGKIMAIAFMANAQHLYYLESVLAENGIEVPKSYEEMLAAAAQLKEAGVMANPIASNMAPGWNIAAEFVNMYLGTGNDLFVPGTAQLNIDNDDSRLVLETLKNMVDYMDSDWATYDSNTTAPIWEAGENAMAIGWGSRTGEIIGPDAADPAVAADTRFAHALFIGGNEIPSAALWWDGFTIAQNISDEDAEASFIAMMNGISPEMMAENAESAVWLIKGYEPTRAAGGVIANLEAGARPYPMLPFMGLLHTALGDNLAEYLQGAESADQAIADVITAYETAATEAGFLK